MKQPGSDRECCRQPPGASPHPCPQTAMHRATSARTCRWLRACQDPHMCHSRADSRFSNCSTPARPARRSRPGCNTVLSPDLPATCTPHPLRSHPSGTSQRKSEAPYSMDEFRCPHSRQQSTTNSGSHGRSRRNSEALTVDACSHPNASMNTMACSCRVVSGLRCKLRGGRTYPGRCPHSTPRSGSAPTAITCSTMRLKCDVGLDHVSCVEQ